MWEGRRRSVFARLVIAAGAAGLLAFSARAHAATCRASAYETAASTRDEAMVEAGGFAANAHWADARAVYLWVLARHRDDAEALYGLARVDAWEGCWELAESEYSRVIGAHPRDSDVRAGFIDLLLWRGRFDEAEALIEEGLVLEPKSPALLGRLARLMYWRGDAGSAIRLADEAERLAPEDGDLRAARDRMFRGEARLTAHMDRYPPGYQDLHSLAAQVLQRTGRFEVYGGAQVLQRYGGNAPNAVLDARFSLGGMYHPALGVLVGAEVAAGAPANAIPNVATKVWALTPLTTRLSAYFAYAFWHFDGDQTVHTLNPSIGIALPLELRLDLRGWLSAVRLPPPDDRAAQVKLAGSGGLQLTWSATRRVDIGGWYTYGAQIDQNPALFQLLEYRTHVMGTFADILLHRYRGVRPLVAVERRQAVAAPPEGARAPAVWIGSFEISGYVRW